MSQSEVRDYVVKLNTCGAGVLEEALREYICDDRASHENLQAAEISFQLEQQLKAHRLDERKQELDELITDLEKERNVLQR